MMKKAILVLSVALLGGIVASGQSTDYNRTEFFAGFSHGQVDNSNSRYNTTSNFRDTGAAKFNGFNISGVYNISRYVGLKADLSGTYNRNEFSFPVTVAGGPSTVSGNNKSHLYNVLGGVQFKDNSVDRVVKPFGHVLVGAGIARSETSNTACPQVCAQVIQFPDTRETGFAGAIGGGVDIKLNERIDIRAVQLDYNPIRFNSAIDHNFRIGIGIVIK